MYFIHFIFYKNAYFSWTAVGAPGTYAFTDPTRILCSLSNLDSLLSNDGGS
jgi:hypothetical protein